VGISFISSFYLNDYLLFLHFYKIIIHLKAVAGHNIRIHRA